MPQRMANMIIHPSGGTAGKGGNTYKLTLPSTWIKEMGISEVAREVELSFDGQVITIARPQTAEGYISARCKLGHSLVKLSYFDGDRLCTTIVADETAQDLRVINHTDCVIKTAFGRCPSPSWEDLQQFLEERCIPKTRDGLREYLETIGVEGYNPLEIIKKTKGRMAEDDQWIKVEVLA